MSTWKTLDGRVLVIKWMDSVHLVNSTNMQISKLTGFMYQRMAVLTAKSTLYPELKARRLWEEDKARSLKLVVPTHRETPVEMCVLRAILDTEPALMQHWVDDREEITKLILGGGRRYQKIYLKFTEYRLTR
jgi:hypothetical protein